MTKKDYILIAKALKETFVSFQRNDQTDKRTGVVHAIEHIATVLGQDNPRFDRDRFIGSCGHGDQA